MGTKNKPGSFDCYLQALPEEPLFTLLARDRHAPDTVEKWADSRELEIRRGYGGNKEKLVAELQQLAEARKIAGDMRNWRRQNMGVWKGALPAAPLLSSSIIIYNNRMEADLALAPRYPFMLTPEEELMEGISVMELQKAIRSK